MEVDGERTPNDEREASNRKICAEEQIAIAKVQLLLTEKRTSLATLRNGIAVFALPLSVLGLLVATSRLYDPHKVLYWLVPLIAICAGLAGLGAYLIVRAVMHIRQQDRMIRELKERDERVGKLIV